MGEDGEHTVDAAAAGLEEAKRPTLEAAREAAALVVLVAVAGAVHRLAQTAQSESSSSSNQRRPVPRDGNPDMRHLQTLISLCSADETLSTKYP